VEEKRRERERENKQPSETFASLPIALTVPRLNRLKWPSGVDVALTRDRLLMAF
jgi:hypothetical protein